MSGYTPAQVRLSHSFWKKGRVKQNPADAITKVILKMESIGVTVAGTSEEMTIL